MKRHLQALILLSFILPSVKAQNTYTFTGKPVYDILAKQNNTVMGTIRIELYPTIAPKHARNFDSLVSMHFYDTTAFHRVIPGFMIQGGDPNSRHGDTTTWGYGQLSQPTVPAEFSVLKHVRGILSAARKANDINSATSQFFICVATASQLNNQYSIYGHVVSGMNIVDQIVNSPRNPTSNKPYQKIEMFVSRIGSNDSIPPAPALKLPPHNTWGVSPSGVQTLSWAPVPGAIAYEVYVSTDNTFSIIDTSAIITGNTFVFKKLMPYNSYYWTVRADNGGNSTWSDVWHFSTDFNVGTSSVSGIENIGLFPNPGSGRFTVTSTSSGQRVRICQADGKLVTDISCSQGSTDISLAGHAAGIYSYSILDANGASLKTGRIVLK
jgi:peptidyl-prolyl cis-trans isomerase B (cyclophilin B)